MTLIIDSLKELGITKLSSTTWNPEIIGHHINFVCEGSSYDRKEQITHIGFNFSKLSSIEYADKVAIQNFITDAIAMANSARRRGETCYIVFGVNDDWEYMPNGILYQLTQPLPPEKYEEWCVTKPGFQRLQLDYIARDFSKYVEEFIEPEPYFSYEFGWIEEEYLIGYLAFHELASEQPFRVRDSSRLSAIDLEKGLCWTRRNDSNKKVVGKNVDYLAAWRDIPFVPVKQWLAYIEHAQEQIKRATQTDFAPQLSAIISQTIKAKDQFGTQIEDVVAALYAFTTGREQHHILYLIGGGGVGKSTALRETVSRLLAELYDDIDIGKRGMKADQPTVSIPIYVDLRNFRSANEPLDAYIISYLNGVSFDSHDHFSRILSDRELQFVICFDAIDEIPNEFLHDATLRVNRFMYQHPSVRFIVASRPHVLGQHTANQQTLFIESYVPLQIKNRLGHAQVDEANKRNLVDLVAHDVALLNMLNIPRLLDSCILGLTTSSHFSLGTVVKAAMDGFFQREKKILGFDEFQQFRNALDQFAELFWDETKVLARHTASLPYIQRFLQTGIVRETDDSSHLAFASEYIKYFLLADRLNLDEEYRRSSLGKLHANPQRYAVIIRFLANWSQNELSTSFLDALIGATNDFSLILDIYIERQNPNLENGDNIYLALASISDNLNVGEDFPFFIRRIEDLLNDVNDVVVDETVKALLNYESLRKICAWEDIIQRFEAEIDLERKNTLWPLVKALAPLSPIELIDRLVTSSAVPLNRDYVIDILASDINWSDGCPPELYTFIAKTVDEEIILFVLQNLNSIPEQLEETITSLLAHQNSQVADHARRILNQPALDEADDEARVDASDGVDEPEEQFISLDRLSNKEQPDGTD